MSKLRKEINVLTTVSYYLPGFKAGGPLRSISNLVAKLDAGYIFRIVTYDRDFGDSVPYTGIKVGDWNNIGNTFIYFLPHRIWSFLKWRKILTKTGYDVLYLNSLLSPQFTIVPLLLRRIGLIPYTPVIVAPRGEFSQGALAIKWLKKKTYIYFAKSTGLYKGILWHASSEYEKQDIERIMGRGGNIHVAVHVAADIAELTSTRVLDSVSKKKSNGIVRLVFLSRLSRKKNLDGALRMLEGAKGQIKFDIYGPMEDSSYWVKCMELAKRLPGNISVEYKGAVPHDRVQQVLSEYHFFYFPTLGENFGHVIYEALSAGLPVILSDQTPWRNLPEYAVGWDLPLSRPEEFQDVLQRCVEMRDQEYQEMSQKATRFADEGDLHNGLEQHRELFRKSLGTKI